MPIGNNLTIDEDLPPDPELIESMRAMGYTSQTAIADVLDNSVAAQANVVEIFGDATKIPYLCIADDGVGMSQDELRVAMRYAGKNVGTSRGKKDLGRFGLGLKTASLSQARRLVVISKRKDLEPVGAVWDVDHVITSGKWSLIWLDQSQIQQYLNEMDYQLSARGTLVIWQKLDTFLSAAKNPELAMSKKLEDIGLHLSLVFHRYLSGELDKKLTIKVNKHELHPTDPFFRKNQSTQMKSEKIRVGRSHVVVNAYIIPTARLLTSQDQKTAKQLEKLGKELQGFYVYRQFRLIVWGTWYRIAPKNELSKFARIMVDTPTTLDKEWDLDVTKSKGIPPLSLRQNLSRLVPSIIKESQRVAGKKTSNKPDPEGRYWAIRSKSEHAFSIEINRENKSILRLSESLNESQNKLLSLLFDSLEKGFPAMEFSARINGDERFGESRSAEEALKDAREIFIGLRAYFELEVAFETLLAIEPFCSDPRLLDLLKTRKNEITKDENE
jgi:hypothetical protein